MRSAEVRGAGKRVFRAVLALLFAGAVCCSTVSAAAVGTERISFDGYAAENSTAAVSGTTLNIPVIISGYSSGINQYAVEFTAESPLLSQENFTVTPDKTMIQHSVSADTANSSDVIQHRYLQTVKMAEYPDYGVNETRVGTVTLQLPRSKDIYDVTISARIIESTTGLLSESPAAPSTGDFTIRVYPKAIPAESPVSPLLSAGAFAAAAFGTILLKRRDTE